MIKDQSEAMALVVDICEVFEDFLDARGIVLKNDEKDDDPDASNLYGMDFAEVYDGVANILQNAKLIDEEILL